MDIYDQELHQVTKTLEKMIEMKWISKNELINLEAISHNIVGDLNSLKRERQKTEDIANAFDALRKYMPDVYEKLIEEIKK